ncbi:MAG: ester cyclase [Proteobacteria bacterium]|nr:ester cyclase [Pseudomonadota bacterium]
MSTEENKAIVRRGFEEGWNKGNLAIFDELMATDVLYHAAEIRSLEAFKQLVTADLAAYPDLQITIEDMIAEGDKVVVRYTFRGTQEGETQGIPPTGKHVTVTGISICRCAGGKIVEEWENWDDLGLLQQLGVIPPLGESEG